MLLKGYKAKQHRNNNYNEFGRDKKISGGCDVISVLILRQNNQSITKKTEHQDIQYKCTGVDILSTCLYPVGLYIAVNCCCLQAWVSRLLPDTALPPAGAVPSAKESTPTQGRTQSLPDGRRWTNTPASSPQQVRYFWGMCCICFPRFFL